MDSELKKDQSEISAWNNFNHPNIAQVLGAVNKFGLNQEDGIVTPWMEKGNLDIFLDKENATITLAARFQIVRLYLIVNLPSAD